MVWAILVEGVGSGRRVVGEEVGPRVERRSEVVRPAAAVLGVVEGELGERDRVLGLQPPRDERRVQRPERSRGIVAVALDQVLLVEKVVGPAADLAGGERVARDHPPRPAGTHVPGLDRRGAGGRDESRAAEQRDAADHLIGFCTETETASRYVASTRCPTAMAISRRPTVQTTIAPSSFSPKVVSCATSTCVQGGSSMLASSA